jgi:hypothetical protein
LLCLSRCLRAFTLLKNNTELQLDFQRNPNEYLMAMSSLKSIEILQPL